MVKQLSALKIYCFILFCSHHAISIPSSLYHQLNDLTLPNRSPFSPWQKEQVRQLQPAQQPCQGCAVSSREAGKREWPSSPEELLSIFGTDNPCFKGFQDPFTVSHPSTGRSVHTRSRAVLPEAPAGDRQQTAGILPSAKLTGSPSSYAPIPAAPAARTDVNCWMWMLLQAHLPAAPGRCGLSHCVSAYLFPAKK